MLTEKEKTNKPLNKISSLDEFLVVAEVVFFVGNPVSI